MVSSSPEPLVLSEQVEINTPPPAVWHVFRDLEGWPGWCSVFREAVWTEGASWRRGSTFRLGLQWAERVVSLEARLVEDDLPWILTWTSQGGDLAGHYRFDLDWIGRKSIVTLTITLQGEREEGRRAQVEAATRSMLRSWLSDLKAEVERSGPAFWELTSRGDPGAR